jgi:FkbH-like protein
MESYLRSLVMVGTIKSFDALDAPRISQLINRSNQFNLTTRRRTETEVLAVIADDQYSAFTVRLADRFGDHGLIAVVIGQTRGKDFYVDTWLMSCRVLKRQVEEEVLNEIVFLASERGCTRVVGEYIPTAKNGMVSDLYPKLGFTHVRDEANGTQVYELSVDKYQVRPTQIKVNQETYAAAGSNG